MYIVREKEGSVQLLGVEYHLYSKGKESAQIMELPKSSSLKIRLVMLLMVTIFFVRAFAEVVL